MVTMSRSRIQPRTAVFLAAATSVSLLGCSTRGLQVIASGKIGCPPDEIEISNVDTGYSASTWTATCRGVRHFCSSYVSNPISAPPGAFGTSSTSCEPEQGTSDVAPTGAAGKTTADPPSTPSVATSEAPSGAAGFAFGDSAEKASKVCVDATFEWSRPGDGDRGECAGAPTDVGFDASVSLAFCGDKVCTIGLRHSLADVTVAKEWLSRYTAMVDLVRRKYGAPTSREDAIPESCRGEVRRCVTSGELQLQSRWQWADGRTIRVVLGPAGGTVNVFVIYGDAQRPRGAPGL